MKGLSKISNCSIFTWSVIVLQMILSFELPFALIPLLKFTSCKTKMGIYANSITVKLILTYAVFNPKFESPAL